MSIKTTIFGRLFRLNTEADEPPWQMDVWDRIALTWRTLGSARGGHGGSPLLAPGPAPLAAEIVCLPGDPPDAATIGGDFVWLRRYAPNFTLSPQGDITTVEGL